MENFPRYVVEVTTRPYGEVLTRVVATPYGEYKAGAVAVLAMTAENHELRYGKVCVRRRTPGENLDPSSIIVDPWAPVPENMS